MQQLLDCMRRQEELNGRLPDAVDEFIQLDDEFHRMMYFFGGRSHTWLAIRGLVSHYDRMRYLDALDGECDYDRVTVQHRAFCDYPVSYTHLDVYKRQRHHRPPHLPFCGAGSGRRAAGPQRP